MNDSSDCREWIEDPPRETFLQHNNVLGLFLAGDKVKEADEMQQVQHPNEQTYSSIDHQDDKSVTLSTGV